MLKAARNKHLIYREKNNLNDRGFLIRNHGSHKEVAQHFSTIERTVDSNSILSKNNLQE